MPTVFRKIAGRIIPIRVAARKFVQDEAVNIIEVQNARKAARFGGMDKLGGIFLKYTQQRAKKTGMAIAKRIARFKKKGIL